MYLNRLLTPRVQKLGKKVIRVVHPRRKKRSSRREVTDRKGLNPKEPVRPGGILQPEKAKAGARIRPRRDRQRPPAGPFWGSGLLFLLIVISKRRR